MEKLLITTGMAAILFVSYLIALNVKVDITTIAKFVKMGFMLIRIQIVQGAHFKIVEFVIKAQNVYNVYPDIY